MKWISILLLLLLPYAASSQVRDARALRMTHAWEAGAGALVPHDAYPSYDFYVRIMRRLAREYPDRCELQNWGTLPSGREILALRVTRDVAAPNDRPRVLCTATMHGDETAGYSLLLQLAEHLLRDQPDRLTDQLEIYLNPLANPDGAFRAGNHTLAGARRGNAAGVDLNRNYPDPDDGSHPDRNGYQPETRIFMDAAQRYGFDLAINLHGGAEVFNYPWDTYRHRHADTEWWRRVARDFAVRAQAASGHGRYFRDRHDGTTNGHDWYPIAGSRQDYMNYYHRCREATLEVSDAKRYPAARLPELWRAVRPALLGYLREASYGVHGLVTDAVTGRPVAARISIPGHDRENSDVLADERSGDYHRYLAAGTYDCLITADGYHPERRRVTVRDRQRVTFDVALTPVAAPAVQAREKR